MTKHTHTHGPWSVFQRTKREGECGPGLWIYNPDTKRTVCDTGAIDAWPLSDADRRLIEAAPAMSKALQHILVLIQQGVDDQDLKAIEEHCRGSLAEAWGVEYDEVWTPDLDEFIADEVSDEA